MNRNPHGHPSKLENKLLKSYHELLKTENVPISMAELHTLASDLLVNEKICDMSNGDWRVIIFAALDISESIDQEIRIGS